MIGIYKITNIVNNKVYIGQSYDIERRIIQHKKYENNRYLKRSIEKYGIDNFKFDILMIISDNPLTKILLDIREISYIKKFDSTNPNKGYNIKSGGSKGKHDE